MNTVPKNLSGLLAQALSFPASARILAALCAGSLVFAFILQFMFGVDPCILCLWQRVPFTVGLLLALLAGFCPPARKFAPIILGLCAVTFLTGEGLAIFHTGVEQHWWLGTSGCAITPLSGAGVEDLRTQLLHTVVAHCDQISWTFLGLSLANWNVPLSLSLAVFSGLAAKRAKI